MAKTREPGPHDAQPALAIRVGAGDLRVAWSSSRWDGSAAAWPPTAAAPRQANRSRKPWPGGRVKHFALELEIVARPRAAIDLRAAGHDHLDPEVVKLETFVGLGFAHRFGPRSLCRSSAHDIKGRDCRLSGSDQRSTISLRVGVPMEPIPKKPSSGGRPAVVGEVSGQAFRRRRRGRRRLDRVGRGEIVGLIGPNGAGQDDAVRSAGRRVRSRPPAASASTGPRFETAPPDPRLAHGVGRTFQIPRPFPGMTVIENVMLGAQGTERRAHLAELDRAATRARARSAPPRQGDGRFSQFVKLDGSPASRRACFPAGSANCSNSPAR